ncbi:hypothetical protein E2C01_076284 [Portunus trituberculatus]|uniref:Secreted protein n=1 Tax=Portunus trituberculatus TaxID=210409 RepID=A0A5B7IJF0_PORTR|nr:hypothetical protein [Portunus trituberculatus]
MWRTSRPPVLCLPPLQLGVVASQNGAQCPLPAVSRAARFTTPEEMQTCFNRSLKRMDDTECQFGRIEAQGLLPLGLICDGGGGPPR